MRNNARVVEILLAGPSDVKRELRVVRDEIARWNAAHSRTENTFLEPIHWDTHAFPEMGDRPQAIINKQLVDRCDVLIAVFWKIIGSPTGMAASGTIEEIERFRNSGRPVMLYFAETPVPYDADMAKIAQVRQYRKSLDNALYSVFKSLGQFRDRLSVHLPQVIAQLLKNTAANERALSAVKLQEQAATLNRIQAELETTQVVNDFRNVLEKLRPLLLDCIALPRVTRIKEARQNFQSLIWRVTELERFSFNTGTISQFSDKSDELFGDIRAAIEQATAIEGLTEWEIVRYDDLKAKQAAHTTETAWNWPDAAQCQCTDCLEFRALKIKIKNDLNPRFRVFILQFEKQFAELRSRANIIADDIWAWIDVTSRSAKRFEDSFQIQGQLQNARLAERVTSVFGQFNALTPEERLKYSNANFERLFLTVEPVVQMLAGVKGPT